MAKTAKEKERWTEDKVFALLEKRFPAPAYALLSQVRNGTGFARRQDRTADAIAVSCYPSRGLYLAGIEIKVSRSDWMRELADPDKSVELQKYCKYWYVAAPTGVIQPGEVPETWGYLEINKKVKDHGAPPLEHQQPDMLLLCSILRRVAASTVPKGAVNDQIEKARAEWIESQSRVRDYELTALKETVERFEKASGITLQGHRWDAGDIGKAVALLRKCDMSHVVNCSHRMAEEHQQMATQLFALHSELARHACAEFGAAGDQERESSETPST